MRFERVERKLYSLLSYPHAYDRFAGADRFRDVIPAPKQWALFISLVSYPTSDSH